jgi:hypothetical protein
MPGKYSGHFFCHASMKKQFICTMKWAVAVMAVFFFSGTKANAQRTWRPFAALYVTTDAEAVYIGPAFSAGVNYKGKKKTSVNILLHYFGARVNEQLYFDAFDAGIFRLISLAFMPQIDLGRKPGKGVFISGGITYQYRTENYQNGISEAIEKKGMFLPTVKIGYGLPVNKQRNAIAFEIFGTGPYTIQYENGSVTELLTQLSVGLRFTL